MSFLKNRTVVGVICILLSLLICFGLTPLFNQSVSQKAEIVRVVQPIRAGDEITESMVQIVEVGGYNLPEDVLRQKESAVGKYATADLAVGDYKQSKDDTKEEERNINIKQDQLDLLWQLEEFRKKHEHQAEPSDWAIRMCEAFVARSMGFTDRVQWTELLRQKGETLFTFDWKSGSVSDHVVQWCKENNRNWRYSHLGELQVAHGGEWRKVDYFCRDGSETRVYFPPEPVQEQQLHALAEAPAVHLRDLLTLGLPDHDVYLPPGPPLFVWRQGSAPGS